MAQKPGRRREIAVIGLGRFGSGLALTLMEEGYTVLGIDQDAEIVQRFSSSITHAVIMDSTEEDALRQVDIMAFDVVVVAIGSDFESNLLTTVALKSLGVRQVICKSLTGRQREILLRVGADRVVQPEHDAGRRLAEELIAPAMLERLPLGPAHSVAELRVPRSLLNKTLAQVDLRRRHGVTVLVIKRAEQLLVSPGGDTIMLPEDLLVVLGSNTALRSLSNL